MTTKLPDTHNNHKTRINDVIGKGKEIFDDFLSIQTRKSWFYLTSLLILVSLLLAISNNSVPVRELISPILSGSLRPLQNPDERQYEVFGFAPFWTLHKLDNVDFNTLSTLAYFGVPVTADGTLDKSDIGYTKFQSKQATELFMRAHEHGTRVVLTITQMKNHNIEAILGSEDAQMTAINETVEEVKKRGIDGVNVDFEYVGNPGPEYRKEFSEFVAHLTEKMHAEVPNSKVTVSVYASAAKSPKLYDIKALGHSADGIFMMAYDFAVAGSEQAEPTAPLYGHKEGKYAYDIATAVEDFTKQMPADKLILGVPYYGYNYPVSKPQVKASTFPSWAWNGDRATQTYQIAQENVNALVRSDEYYKEGWDEAGQVGWRAYFSSKTNTWRMIFLDDTKSLGIKYDFAKNNNLAGVGMWALGFDQGRPELWDLLRVKFGPKLADASIANKQIN